MSSVALWAIVAESLLHVGEEYVYPGGFLRAMRTVAPRFAVLVNGLFLALVVAAAAIGPTALPVTAAPAG